MRDPVRRVSGRWIILTGRPTLYELDRVVTMSLSNSQGVSIRNEETSVSNCTQAHVREHRKIETDSSGSLPGDEQSHTNREVAEHARWLWERSPLGYLIVDRLGRIITLNAAARALLGGLCDEPQRPFLTDGLEDHQRHQLLGRLAAAHEGCTGEPIELELGELDAVVRTVRLSFLSIRASTVTLAVQDITAQRHLQRQACELKEQIRHLQRLELINDIAAGVAHDFNNVLQVIGGFAGVLKYVANMPERANDSIEEILIATERGAVLTRKLLEFSRKAKLTLQPLDIAVLAQHCMKIVSRSLPRSIELQMVLPDAKCICRVDARLIEQSLLNLLLNARDAMPIGGQLTVSIERCRCPEQSARQGAQAAGEWVCIAVRDTGVGIAEEIKDRIFEPFFTTKVDGAGTGLGLALVRGIVADHNGWIEVESQVGRGSTFRVYLPIAAE